MVWNVAIELGAWLRRVTDAKGTAWKDVAHG